VLSSATEGPCIATTAITSTANATALANASAISLGAYELGTS